jgi:transposase
MKDKNRYKAEASAARAGMSVKTARKYLALGKLPSEVRKPRTHRTRKDPFEAHAEEIRMMYQRAPELQAKTVLSYLMEKYPGAYRMSQGRSLRRRLQVLRAEFGKPQEVIFCQDIRPGRQSQSDWTCMNSLNIVIGGTIFPHLLFHFMLPYSLWESVMICHTESLETLTQGCEKAFWELGGVLGEHRTDNLTAATQKLGSTRQFTQNWQDFLTHYRVEPSRNNPGVSHENGSVEKSHDLLKEAINQHLLIRGSRDFESVEAYQAFLEGILTKRNAQRGVRVCEEAALLKPLPDRRFRAPQIIPVRVSPFSTIKVLGVTYSVPSRLIKFCVQAHVYGEYIDLYYGHKKIEHLVRQAEGKAIDYRHIIDHLVRKPGAFPHYQYREWLFPHGGFKGVHETLQELVPEKADVFYLKILQLAKLHGEANVIAALEILSDEGQPPLPETIKALLDKPCQTIADVTVFKPCLKSYETLLTFHLQEGKTSCH